jgi:hypothetical protein
MGIFMSASGHFFMSADTLLAGLLGKSVLHVEHKHRMQAAAIVRMLFDVR